MDCGLLLHPIALWVRFFNQRLRVEFPKQTLLFGLGNRVVPRPQTLMVSNSMVFGTLSVQIGEI